MTVPGRMVLRWRQSSAARAALTYAPLISPTNEACALMTAFAQIVAQVDPRKISTCVVHGSIGSLGAASVVFPYVSQARRYGHDARKDATIKGC